MVSHIQSTDGRALAEGDILSTDHRESKLMNMVSYLGNPKLRPGSDGLWHPYTKNGLDAIENGGYGIDIDVFDIPKGHNQLVMGATGYPYRAQALLRSASYRTYGEQIDSDPHGDHTEKPAIAEVKTRYYVLSKRDVATLQAGEEKARAHILKIIQGISHCQVCGGVDDVAETTNTFKPMRVHQQADGNDILSYDKAMCERFGITKEQPKTLDSNAKDQEKKPIDREQSLSIDTHDELSIS